MHPMTLMPTRGSDNQRLDAPESWNSQQIATASNAGIAQIAASRCIDTRATRALPDKAAASARCTRCPWYRRIMRLVSHDRRTSAIRLADSAELRLTLGESGRCSLILGIHNRMSVQQAANNVDAGKAEQDDPIAPTEKHCCRD